MPFLSFSTSFSYEVPPFLMHAFSHLCLCVLQEWPEEDYPIYANGPGYVISSDIADSILSEFLNLKLRVSSVDFFWFAFRDTYGNLFIQFAFFICNNWRPA
jgi:hypothetical protein